MYSTLPFDSLADYYAAEPMLHSIFGFKHCPAPQSQSKDAPRWFCSLFSKYVKALQDSAAASSTASTGDVHRGLPWSDTSQQDLASFSKAAGMLQGSLDYNTIAWLPDFGCAILGLANPIAAKLAELSLHVVALDGWQYKLHSHPGGIDKTSAPTKHAFTFGATIPADKYSIFEATMHNMIAARQQLKVKDGAKGFQRTPAFIQAVVQDAVLCVVQYRGDVTAFKSEVGFREPAGGFTDVGQHTGGLPRDTSWPLVRETMLAVLQHGGCCHSPQQPVLLFHQAMLHLELWLLLGLLKLVTPATAKSQLVDACYTMLHSVSLKAANFAVDGRDMSAVLSACEHAQQQIQAAVSQQELQHAEQLQLPAAGCRPGAGSLLGSWCPPAGVLPAEVSVGSAADDLAASRQRAKRNLGSLPAVPDGLSFMQALQELQSLLQTAKGSLQCASVTTADVAAQLALRSVEAELFTRAVAGIDGPDGYANLTDDQLDLLWQVVGLYRLVGSTFRNSTAGKAAMQVEQRSREVLVALIAYCITFEAARQHAVIRNKYGVAPTHTDLQHLVLSDKAAVDAVLALCSYLQRHTVQGRPLFSTKDGGSATFDMAEQYARGDNAMRCTWQQEQAAAQARVRLHWRKVTEQQAEARRLRSKLQSLRSDESSYSSQLSCAYYCSSEYYSLSSKLSDVRSDISSAESQLKAAEHPPPPVIQPLPQQHSLAFRWIFFLYMPSKLRHLAAASFLVQQLLLPLPLQRYSDAMKAVTVTDFESNLTSHYNCHQASSNSCSSHRTGTEGLVKLYSPDAVPKEKNVNKSHIDHFYSQSDGVWYPDSLQLHMAWSGFGDAVDRNADNCGFFFDPFRPVPHKLVVDSFTEQLAQHDKASSSLQWGMSQYGDTGSIAADRGNLGIAQQDGQMKPSWLSKPAYLAFSALRSYPLRQLHRLCEQLHDNKLPWGHPTVHMLVKQTLYHIGPIVQSAGSGINGSSQFSLLWRTGWEREGGVLQALCYELSRLANELEQTPRGHDAILLLGEMAAYLSDWHPQCTAVACRFAAMSSKAADYLQSAINSAAGQEDVQAELMAKQCKARMMALLCYGAGPLDMQDAGRMVKLMVQIKHGDIYLGKAGAEHNLAGLRVLCHNTMCRRIRELNSLCSCRAVLPIPAGCSALLLLQCCSVSQTTWPGSSWELLTAPMLPAMKL